VVTYTPNAGFSGFDRFEYEVCDNDGDCDNAAVDISIHESETDEGVEVTEPSVLSHGPEHATNEHAVQNNPINALDVNGDGHVSPIDAILVINALNADFNGAATQTTQTTSDFADVDGDGIVSAIDALHVINYLNQAAAHFSQPTTAPVAAIRGIDLSISSTKEANPLRRSPWSKR
jgi:hypothetical protein